MNHFLHHSLPEPFLNVIVELKRILLVPTLSEQDASGAYGKWPRRILRGQPFHMNTISIRGTVNDFPPFRRTHFLENVCKWSLEEGVSLVCRGTLLGLGMVIPNTITL